MFVLHVDLKLKPASGRELERVFEDTFRPAISRQEGFRAVTLLRAQEQKDSYVLSIVFDDQSLQQKWVATALHQEVWPQMESHCASYAVKSYEAV